MNYSIDWSELSLQLVLTFGHFLWQACVAGVLLEAALRLAKLHTARSERTTDVATTASSGAVMHHAMACAAFFLLPVCVVATFAWVHQSRRTVLILVSRAAEVDAVPIAGLDQTGSQPSAATALPVPRSELPAHESGTSAASFSEPAQSAVAAPAPAATWVEQLKPFAPSLLIGYLVGAGLLLVRFGASLIGSVRLRRSVEMVTDSQLLAVIAEQSKRLGLRKEPLVALCQKVSVPVVVGILKPMILLPPALITGLGTDQLAAILSHEMAHIRRYDLLVNLLQRVIEAFLFFHPITWWISRRISVERENCCDDLAARSAGSLSYVDALLKMAEVCLSNDPQRKAALASLAASGRGKTQLGHRIRRLIGVEQPARIGWSRAVIAATVAVMLLTGVSLAALVHQPESLKEMNLNINEHGNSNFVAARLEPPKPRFIADDDIEQTLEDCVTWLDGLNFVEKNKKPSFVRIRSPYNVGFGTLRDTVVMELDRNESEARCLTLDLLPKTVPLNPNPAVPGGRPFQSLDYRRAFLLFRRELKKRLKDHPELPLWNFEMMEVVTFLLISKNAGEKDSHDQIVATVRSNRKLFSRLNKRYLESSLATYRLHTLHTQLGGWPEAGRPPVSRQQLLNQIRLYLKRFPNSEKASHAKQMVPLLEKSIADEKRHPARSPDEIRAMAERKDVAGLIEQLQYVSGAPYTNDPFFPNPFAPIGFSLIRPSRGEGPGHELIRLGDVAVPKLIEALRDDRLTYSTTSMPDWRFQKLLMNDGHTRVLSCGECAALILEQIMAGEEFHREMQLTLTGLFEPKPHLEKIERRAREWWDEYRNSDRTEFWATKLETSRVGFYDIAERWFRVDPERATTVLVPLLEKRGGYGSRWLIESIAETKPAGYADFLNTLTKSGSPSVRFAAIGESWKLNKQASIDPLWRDWQAIVSGTLPTENDRRDPNYVGKLAKFLLNTGPASIDRMRDDLSKASAYTVKLVMWRLPMIWNYNYDGNDQEKHRKVIAWRATPEGMAVTRLLITASNDQRRQKKYSASFPEYRVCDQAAWNFGSCLRMHRSHRRHRGADQKIRKTAKRHRASLIGSLMSTSR